MHVSPVEDMSRLWMIIPVPWEAFCGDLSSKSSTRRHARAHRKSFDTFATVCFPHFHSDGYYYYLYPYSKTGYSSHSKPHMCTRLSSEEIQQWNSA
jgi:hypothetical protein